MGNPRRSARDKAMLDLVAEYGLDCYLCREPLLFRFVHLHHLNKNYQPLNAIENVRLTHPDCNDRTEREDTAQVGEREKGAGVPTQYSAQEGRDHASMRRNWDDWTRGRREPVYPPLAELRQTGNRGWWKAVDLALKAPSACRDPEDEVPHSSKTFRVYLEEDISEGLYDSKVKKGLLWVRISDHFLGILEVVGQLNPSVSIEEDGA